MPFTVVVTLASLVLLAGCTTRDAWQPPRSNDALAHWQSPAGPVYQAPRLVLVTCTVEQFRWYGDLTSWRHSQELLDAAFSQWLQVPAARRFALREPDRDTLDTFFTQTLPQQLGPDDVLVLYFGTHQLRDGRILLAGDSQITGADLGRWLGGLPGKRQVLLADICHAQELETSAGFDQRVARLYATRTGELAPDLPLDTSLRQVTRFFADTQAIIHHDLGIHHKRYSLLGLMAVHALRVELQNGATDLQLLQLYERMDAERRRLDPLVRRIEIPRFAAHNLQPWSLAQQVTEPLPVVTAGDRPRPDSLEDLLALPDDQIDVGLGNLLVGRQYDPSVDPEQHLQTLDAMARTLRQRLGGEQRPAHVIAIINDYLYDELAFASQEAPYTTDFLLHELLTTRQGRCSALVSLYMALGQRLGLPLRSVCIPEHIFVRWVRQPGSRWDWPDDQHHLNIETTLGGVAMSDEQYQEMHNWQLTDQGRRFYLQPLGARQTVGTLYSPLASALLTQGLADEAVAASRQAIAINPEDAEAWNNLGMARRQQDKGSLAIACYRRALEIHPRFAEAWNNLGALQPTAAARVRYFRQAVTLKPNLGEAWKNLAYAYFDLGDYDQTQACVDRCRALDYPLPTPFLEALAKRRVP